jgi:DNA-binding NarL/FixJ family response regulator
VSHNPSHAEDHPSRLALRVLVADDEANVRSALRLLLEQEPIACLVSEAVSAECLLRCALAAQPDVVLLDWDLPGLNAGGLVEQLGAMQPKLHVIALSGRPEAEREALSRGVESFVCKGDAPDVLLAAVRALTAVLS